MMKRRCGPCSPSSPAPARRPPAGFAAPATARWLAQQDLSGGWRRRRGAHEPDARASRRRHRRAARAVDGGGARALLTGHDTGFIMLACGQSLLYGVAVLLLLRHGIPRRALVLCLVCAALMRVIPLTVPPVMSDDIYRYVWDAACRAPVSIPTATSRATRRSRRCATARSIPTSTARIMRGRSIRRAPRRSFCW
ncbi:MAG: hypothetical protein WDO24_05610 [Pseudomonadota bacterium]